MESISIDHAAPTGKGMSTSVIFKIIHQRHGHFVKILAIFINIWVYNYTYMLSKSIILFGKQMSAAEYVYTQKVWG